MKSLSFFLVLAAISTGLLLSPTITADMPPPSAMCFNNCPCHNPPCGDGVPPGFPSVATATATSTAKIPAAAEDDNN
ncbi:hypothetical protein RYX36_028620 [Vicia faba]